MSLCLLLPYRPTKKHGWRAINILDTPSDERFDRFTRLAKRFFNVPMAMVSMIDADRQSLGLNFSETERQVSFCGHAILNDNIMVINDATKDQRFANNPIVVLAPFIRFYAGCPLNFMDGSALGTLCIMDTKPRNMSADDLETLKDLAVLVERELSAIQLATQDELTKLHNRRGFMALAQQALTVCVREGTRVSIVFFDLNKFKAINDRFGHAEGDNALVAFSECMRLTFRGSDIISRFSGDEFVALLVNTSEQHTGEVIKRFSEAIDGYNKREQRGYDLAFSTGVFTLVPDKNFVLEELLSEADARMYAQKKG